MAIESYHAKNVLGYPGYLEKIDLSRRHKQEFLEYACDHFSRYEGFVCNLYLDTTGNVTVGIGHYIPTPEANAALPYEFRVLPVPARPVTDDEKIEEWKNMKALATKIDLQQYRGGSEFFRKRTKLDMKMVDAKHLFFRDATVRIDELKNIFPDYESYPDAAKLGILDVYFNVGGGARFRKFEKFKAAVFKEDWLTAKVESRRGQISDDRNNAVYVLFEEAHTVQQEKGASIKMRRDEINQILKSENDYPDIW